MFEPEDPNSETLSFGERIERLKYVVQMRADARKLQIEDSKERYLDLVKRLKFVPLRIYDYFSSLLRRLGNFLFAGIWFWFGHQHKKLTQLNRDIADQLKEQANWSERVAARREFAEEARAIREAAKAIELQTRIKPLEDAILSAQEQDGSMALRMHHLGKIFCIAAFVVVASLYVAYVAFNSTDTSDRIANAPVVAEPAIESNSTEELLAKLAERSTLFGTGEKVSISELKRINSEAAAVAKRREVNASQLRKIDLIRANNVGMIFQALAESHVGFEDEQKELEAFCSEYESSDDTDLRNAAKFWKFAMSVIAFATNPSELTLEAYRQGLAEHGHLCESNATYSVKVATMLKHMSAEHRNNKLTAIGLHSFYDQIQSSNTPAIQRTADEIYELAIFGRFDLPTLRKRLIWGGFTAKEDLFEVLKTLETHPDSGLGTWSKIIRACECLLASNDPEDVRRTIDFVERLVSRLPESIKKQRLTAQLELQSRRIVVAQAELDLSGKLSPEGKRFDPSSHEYSLVVFLDGQEDSIHELEQLKLVANAISNESQTDFHAVLAFNENVDSTQLDLTLPANVSVSTDTTSRRYHTSFPVDDYPYAVLVGRDDQVVAANINVTEVETRIARHKSSSESQRNREALVLQ